MTIKKYGIFKFQYRKNSYNGQEKELIETGVIFDLSDDEFWIITTKNEEIKIPAQNIIKISSTRLSEEIRNALLSCAKYKNGILLDLREIEKLQSLLPERRKLYERERKKLIEVTGYLPVSDFACRFLIESRKKFDVFNAYVSNWTNNSNFSGFSFDITISKDIEKWASPETYPFIYREYDGCCFIKENNPTYKKELSRQISVFKTIPAFDKITKPEFKLSLGDKNWLTIDCRYRFVIKGEPTVKNLQKLLANF